MIRMWQQRDTEEIAQLPIIPFPKPLPSPPKEAPVEVWGLREWSQHLANAWFTDDLSTTDGTKANGKWQPVDSGNGMAITEEGFTS